MAAHQPFATLLRAVFVSVALSTVGAEAAALRGPLPWPR